MLASCNRNNELQEQLLNWREILDKLIIEVVLQEKTHKKTGSYEFGEYEDEIH